MTGAKLPLHGYSSVSDPWSAMLVQGDTANLGVKHLQQLFQRRDQQEVENERIDYHTHSQRVERWTKTDHRLYASLRPPSASTRAVL